MRESDWRGLLSGTYCNTLATDVRHSQVTLRDIKLAGSIDCTGNHQHLDESFIVHLLDPPHPSTYVDDEIRLVDDVRIGQIGISESPSNSFVIQPFSIHSEPAALCHLKIESVTDGDLCLDQSHCNQVAILISSPEYPVAWLHLS